MNFGVRNNQVVPRVISMPQQQGQPSAYGPRSTTRPIPHVVQGPAPNGMQHNVPKPMDVPTPSIPARSLTSRTTELLDQVRVEIEMLTAEVASCRAEKAEYEQKYRQLLTEMDRIQRTADQLKEQHLQLKARHEEDLSRRSESHQGSIQINGVRQGSAIPSPLLNNGVGQNRAILGPRGGGMVPLEQVKTEGRRWNMQDASQSSKIAASVAPPSKRLRSRSPDSYAYSINSDGRKNSNDNLMASSGGEGGPYREQIHGVDQNLLYRMQTFQPPNDRSVGQIYPTRSPKDRYLPPSIAQTPHRLIPPPTANYQPSPDHHMRGAEVEVKPGTIGPIHSKGLYRLPPSQTRLPNGEQIGQPIHSPSYQRGNIEAIHHNPTWLNSEYSRGLKGVTDIGNPDRKLGYIQHSPSLQMQFQEPNWSLEYMKGGNVRRPAVELVGCLSIGSVVCCVRFSPCGTKVATGSFGFVKVFEVASGKEIFEHKKVVSNDDSEADPFVRAVCMSPDSKKVVAVMENNSARILSLSKDVPPISLVGHHCDVHSLDWIGDIIASGSADCQVRLWESKTGKCRQILGDPDTSPKDGVTCVALRPDGKLVAASSIDTTIHLWDTSDGKLIYRLDKYSKSVYSVAFSADGSQLISGGLDETTKVWDIGKGSFPSTPPTSTVLNGHTNYVLSVCCTYDGRYIVSGSVDNTVIMWDIELKKAAATLRGFQNHIIGVGACPNQRIFATGGGDKILCLWKYTEAEDREQEHLNSSRNNPNLKNGNRTTQEEVRNSDDEKRSKRNNSSDTETSKSRSTSSHIMKLSGRSGKDSSSREKNKPKKQKEESDNSEYGVSEHGDSELSN